ncbi:MAG: hypothetical protein CMI66_06170 [Pedosphaera sp.]|nr:hypothetical protein [Pedosphaera sp.]HBP56133.1 hypothetical protein [Verrucomicrobiales bacterium]HCP39306.1 hypothetical protein [Verrucomicrobiales bacterium]HCZ04965.1 hypothetical protein [Verrucomicrobiales bacterium]
MIYQPGLVTCEQYQAIHSLSLRRTLNLQSSRFGAGIIRRSPLLRVNAFSFVFLTSWITNVQLSASNVIFCIQDLDETRLLAKEERKPLLIIFRCEP